MMLSSRILSFYKSLEINARLPAGIKVMNPYRESITFEVCAKFYAKYYHDSNPRTLLLGINPGRFGSGTTGISFTDPIRLAVECGIENPFPKKPELSSDFIYRMISAYGGPEAFYSKYLISAVSPLGFLHKGNNINYYDLKKLRDSLTPFIVHSIERLIEMGMDKTLCFCIGEGENFRFLNELNKRHVWFHRITPLSHPRFIMQYRRKKLEEYITAYLHALKPNF